MRIICREWNLKLLDASEEMYKQIAEKNKYTKAEKGNLPLIDCMTACMIRATHTGGKTKQFSEG